MSILRKFAAALGVSLDELTPRGKRMSRKLDVELESCGCWLSPSAFRELLEVQKDATSPNWTPDDLTCHPDEAKAFCELIRCEAACPQLPDYLILRTLLNIRKSH